MPVLPRSGCALKTNHKNGGSFLYNLDPRIKLLLVMFFTVLVFIVDSLPVAAAQMLFFFVLCFSARIPFRRLFPHGKFLVFLVVLVIALQVLFGAGILFALMICCRIIALTVLLPILTITTEPRLLACGITRMGFPYKAAFIITSTLNLIPSFEEESRLIMEARKLRVPWRGVKCFKERNLFARLKEYPALALPLMIKAMRKAMMMGLAMDTRAFGAYKTRTWLLSVGQNDRQNIRLSVIDCAVGAAGICYAVLVLTANYYIGN